MGNRGLLVKLCQRECDGFASKAMDAMGCWWCMGIIIIIIIIL